MNMVLWWRFVFNMMAWCIVVLISMWFERLLSSVMICSIVSHNFGTPGSNEIKRLSYLHLWQIYNILRVMEDNDSFETFKTSNCNLTVHFFFCSLLSVVSRSKGKRMSVDKAALPAVQFHPLASPPSKSPPPLPKEAPPPPRPKRPSVSEKVPPKPPSSAGRGALLSQIQKGTRLKTTKTNDRSAPRVWTTKWYHVLVSSAEFVSS